MPLTSTHDLVQLRWRCAQWMLAVVEGNQLQRAALRQAMDIEGFSREEIIDEIALLRQQFDNLRPVALAHEVTRLWIQLQERDRDRAG